MSLPSGQVTFLFTDIEGSTRLAQMLGSQYRSVLTAHRRLLRDTVCDSGGVPMFTEGDSVFVAFSDVDASVRACAEAQRALATHGWPTPQARPRVRMGLHTGYAEPEAGEYASPEVHRAARVAAAAHGGQVLCSGATADLVRHLPDGARLLDLGLFRLRGFDSHERLHQLVAPGLERQFPRPRTQNIPHNLPSQVTSFVGRTDELRTVRDLAGSHRLVTVAGAGGAGKSRLAVAVAGQLVPEYPDGVWFVDVAPFNDPELVAVGVAAALGLRPEPGRPVVDTITEHALNRRLLLVLDTCDAHLTATATLVRRLLAAGPGIRVLATSREPLGLRGEVVWRVPPLSTGDPVGGGTSEAAELLVERVTVARGGTRPGGGELAALARLARRLDGLPLALELAATRLRVLSATELVIRLDNGFTALDCGSSAPDGDDPTDRHATVHGTVTWSYRTLGPQAARTLRWLSVFAGPVGLPAIETLLGGSPLPELAVLVDKSLVQAEPNEEGMTYRMLDAIRGYAGHRLAEAGEENAARARHVTWTIDALNRVLHEPAGGSGALSLNAFDPFADEVRAALRWTTAAGKARDGLLLVTGLSSWWRERGTAREARRWLFRMYQRAAETGEKVSDVELAVAYHLHSVLAGVDSEFAEELRFLRRAEDAARRAQDPGLLARVLAGRGALLEDMGETATAERISREVIAWADDNNVAADALAAVYCLAELLWRRGALDEAAELLANARQWEAVRPAERGRRHIDMLLGMVALSRGDVVAAHDHLVVALRSQMAFGFHARAVETLNAFAVRCVAGGEHETAARLFGAARAARSRLRVRPGLAEPYWSQRENTVRDALGDAAFDAAYAKGLRLPLAEAAAAAAGVPHPDLAEDSDRFTAVGVWARDVAVPLRPAHVHTITLPLSR